MTAPAAPRRGFWFQVMRPVRATGRGIARIAEAFDLLSVIVQTLRGVGWLVRGAGRLLGRAFDG